VHRFCTADEKEYARTGGREVPTEPAPGLVTSNAGVEALTQEGLVPGNECVRAPAETSPQKDILKLIYEGQQELRAQNIRLETKLETVETQNNRLESQNQEMCTGLQTVHTQNLRLESQNTRLETKLDSKETQNTDLKRRLEYVESELAKRPCENAEEYGMYYFLEIRADLPRRPAGI
jgi:chromosome segregation ATPase